MNTLRKITFAIFAALGLFAFIQPSFAQTTTTPLQQIVPGVSQVQVPPGYDYGYGNGGGYYQYPHPMMRMMWWPFGNDYGYGYGYGSGVGHFGAIGIVLMVLFWVIVIALIIGLIRRAFGWRRYHRGPYYSSRALDILNERYAKGEMTKEEYDAKKKDLGL